MISSDDWRLQGQDWLREELLRFQSYRPPREGSEHDHCEFCWAKFMERDDPKIHREGYTTGDGYYWVCRRCFEDFRDLFEWKVVTSDS